MEIDRSLRTVVDQYHFTKVTFSVDGEPKVIGRLLDISDYGFCITIKQMISKFEVEDRGLLSLEKDGKVIKIPVTLKWIDPTDATLRCIGFQSKYNLTFSELGSYIK
jgi:hypothetical protein